MTPEEQKAKKRSYGAAHYAANSERRKAQSAQWRLENRERYEALQLSYRQRHSEKKRAVAAAWRARNPGRHLPLMAEWRRENYARYREGISNWQRDNKGTVNGYVAARKAQKKLAKPAWANEFFILEAYRLAALRTKMLGFPWHVDHIVPLISERVCGLHVEHNLRVIPGLENVLKGNRHWPGMP